MGNMTFMQGFANFFVMSVILLTISNIVNYLIVNVIDPEFGIAVNDIVIEKVIGIMESMGAPEESISETIIKMEEKIESQSSISGLLVDTATVIFWYSIVGLIVAAVLKSKKEDFIETID